MKLDKKRLSSYSDPLNKEQFRLVCHISKRTALYLLQSKLVPNINTGRKTHKYQIRKEDIIAFAKDYGNNPNKYLAPENWYVYKDPSPNGNTRRCYDFNHDFSKNALKYYTELLENEQAILTVKDISRLTGYPDRTITRWIRTGRLVSFNAWANHYYIHKSTLCDFLCGDYYHHIQKKSVTHVATILEIMDM